MQENTLPLSYAIQGNLFNAFFKACSIRVAYTYLNPNPKTFPQRSIKFLLNQSKFLRRKIMSQADVHAEVDIYNLQAIEILEKAGITEPSEQQITTIERLLRAS